MENESAGLHLIVDAYVADGDVFTRGAIEGLFAALVSTLDMRALGPPVVYEVPVDPEVAARVRRTGVFEDSGGITGVQVISTSHIALHAWPTERFFSCDVFSCKDFDADAALGVLRDAMGVTDDTVTVIDRSKPART